MKNLTQKSYLNAAAAFTEYGIRILVNLFLNPILISLIGIQLFGVWQICQRLLSNITMAEGRATQALKWTIAYKQKSDDFNEKKEDVGSSLILWFVFLPVLSLAGALLSWFSPYFIHNLESKYFLSVRICSFVLAANLAFMGLARIPESVLVGANLGYKRVGFRIAVIIVIALLMIGVCAIGWGIIGLAAAVLVGTVLSGSFFWIVAKRNISWLGFKRPSRERFKKFFSFSSWMLGWTFVNRLLLSCDVILLGFIISATAAGSYVLTAYMVFAALNIASIFIRSVVPGLGSIVGSGDMEKTAEIRSEMIVVGWLLAAVFGSFILLWNSSFVGIWVGADKFIGYQNNLYLVLIMVQMIFIRLDGSVIDTTLKIGKKVTLGVFSLAVSIASAFILSKYFIGGIGGILLGLILGRMILTVQYPRLVKKIMKNRTDGQRSKILRPLGMTLLLYGASFVLGRTLLITNWLEFILGACISVVLILATAFFLGLNRDQRLKLLHRLGSVKLLKYK